MGDAILAFFGAPIAHEDDPQRAECAAGLDILNGIGEYRDKVKREKDLDFAVRVGLNTGLVVVGNIGNDLSTNTPRGRRDQSGFAHADRRRPQHDLDIGKHAPVDYRAVRF